MKQQVCDVDMEFGHFHSSVTLGKLVFFSFLNENSGVILGYREQKKKKAWSPIPIKRIPKESKVYLTYWGNQTPPNL